MHMHSWDLGLSSAFLTRLSSQVCEFAAVLHLACLMPCPSNVLHHSAQM